MGATSYLQGRRFTRPRSRQSYYQWLESWLADGVLIPGEVTTQADHLLETLMLGLRLRDGLTWERLLPLTTAQKQQLLSVLSPHLQSGRVEVWGQERQLLTTGQLTPAAVKGFRLSDPDGFLYSNQVLSDLFAQMGAGLE